MENKKSRKIGFTILGFFLQFITDFQSSSEKEKGKDSTVLGRFQPRRPSYTEKRGAPTSALTVLRKGIRFIG
jgi:hypothetical protein